MTFRKLSPVLVRILEGRCLIVAHFQIAVFACVTLLHFRRQDCVCEVGFESLEQHRSRAVRNRRIFHGNAFFVRLKNDIGLMVDGSIAHARSHVLEGVNCPIDGGRQRLLSLLGPLRSRLDEIRDHRPFRQLISDRAIDFPQVLLLNICHRFAKQILPCCKRFP